MSQFLKEEIGVAMSGVKWDVGNFKLWQSVNPNIILFTPKQPVMAISPQNGRYECAVTQFRQQREGTYKITGGSAIFTITSAIQFDAQAFEKLKQQWLSEMNAIGPAPPKNPRFIPLNVQKGKAQVLINPISGKANEKHNNDDIGTPGGTNSFLVELTDIGAQEWIQGIKTKSNIPAGVKFTYEYLRMMPTVGATVHVDGKRAFEHLSGSLNVSDNGVFYGGSLQIDSAWEEMTRNGIIEITFIGTLPPDLEPIRKELVTTFSDQARQQLFDSLFKPTPDVKPAEAGKSGGWFGGANFALKFNKKEEYTDLSLELRFEGWTWLTASMDADLSTLFAGLDESYINEVNTEMSFPASVLVDADPLLSDVAVSWTASEGKSPEAPVFGTNGGTQQYIITSSKPQNVLVKYSAKINYAPSTWPIIETKGEAIIGAGGNQVVLKPSSWIRRHMIYMFVREGDQIKSPSDSDYLICNVSYQGPHLPNTIRNSARITPLSPLEFSYPKDPAGGSGQAKFSAFGVIGNKLVTSNEQDIKMDEEAVFILASDKGIQLASQSSLPETSRDDLAYRLLTSSAHPIATQLSPEGETERKSNEITGVVIAVEYNFESGPTLVVESANGEKHCVRLREAKEADPFDESRKRVKISFDDTGMYAEKIVVML